MEALKYLDAFPKALDEFRVKTSSGAVVSIISIVVITIIFVSELRYYMKAEVVDHLYVNTTWSDKLKVTFDISFPEISCSLLSIDAIDDTGLPQKGAISEIYKHRLWNGQKLGLPELHPLGDTISKESQLEPTRSVTLVPDNITNIEEPKDPCGNCYGAREEGECCNTCNDVKIAYERKGWAFQPQTVTQCAKQVQLDNWKDQNADSGGCQIYGILELNRASGHWHIAPHKKLQKVGEQIGLMDFLELISFTFSQFNITHQINSLRFGDQYPGIRSPLDGKFRSLEDTHGMYQYYLKIVPTVYKGLNNKVIKSNQYAVTEHMRHLAPGSGRGLPGLYFYYELSPIQAVFEERRGHGGLWRFFTSVTAIIGGSFTVFGLIDTFLTYATRVLNKKILR